MAKTIVIPREHGGWAMVSVPFLLGMFAGGPEWIHLPLFLGWFLIYLSSYPFLQAVKKVKGRAYHFKWAAGYMAGALVCLIVPLILLPELLVFVPALLVLFAVNIWHVRRKEERALLNDLAAIASFSLGGAAAYLAGGNSFNAEMFEVFLFNMLYFMGSAFFVKTIFRERGNRRWLWYAWIYHAAVLFVPWLAGNPRMTVPYLYPAVKTFLLAGKKMPAVRVGIIEIAGSLQFLFFSAFLL